MKYKKIIIFCLVFFSLLFTVSFAYDEDDKTAEIDVSTIAENFNKSSYVSKLSSIGINVSAVQTANSIILRYNGSDVVTYNYDESQNLLVTYYPCSMRDTADIVNAILVDTISTMQGNEEGRQIPFALDDTFCFSSVRDLGIEKTYISDKDGSLKIKFQINPFITLSINDTSSAIADTSYLTEYDTFYTTDDCIVKSEDLIFYKTYNDNGLLEIYIGQADELDDFSYESLLNAVSIIFGDGTSYSDKAIAYFTKNYNGFSSGNTEFNGVSIDTSIEVLPVNNVDTIMISPNMKYVKVTIDEKKVKEELSNVIIEDDSNTNSSKSSNNRYSAPMIFSIVIIGMVIIIMLIGILHRRNQSLD